jgi:hypothetical protein
MPGNLGLYDPQDHKHGHDCDRHDADFVRFRAKTLHAFAGLIRPSITMILIGRGRVKPSRNRKRNKNQERHVERLGFMIRCVNKWAGMNGKQENSPYFRRTGHTGTFWRRRYSIARQTGAAQSTQADAISPTPALLCSAAN